MTSTLGSARDTPAHGHVKFVPSMRNRFSLPPDPNADTVLTVPLDGDVGDTPGAARIASNMLNRRVGMVWRYSGPNRGLEAAARALRSASPPSTTTDSATPASFSTAVLVEGDARADAETFSSWYGVESAAAR